jgi:hypothetical protein
MLRHGRWPRLARLGPAHDSALPAGQDLPGRRPCAAVGDVRQFGHSTSRRSFGLVDAFPPSSPPLGITFVGAHGRRQTCDEGQSPDPRSKSPCSVTTLAAAGTVKTHSGVTPSAHWTPHLAAPSTQTSAIRHTRSEARLRCSTRSTDLTAVPAHLGDGRHGRRGC